MHRANYSLSNWNRKGHSILLSKSSILIGQNRNLSNRDLTPNQSDRVNRLLNGILEGNRASLSQSITLVESKNQNKERFSGQIDFKIDLK